MLKYVKVTFHINLHQTTLHLMDKAKNRLQEWAQRRGIALPTYETQKSGPAHKPVFKSCCRVADSVFETCADHSSKKEAEKSAAKIALKELEEETVNESHETMAPASLSWVTIVIVDIDNVDVPIDLMRKHEASFMLFVARNGSKVMTEYEKCENAMIFTTPCVGKDATDVYLTYETKGIRDMFPSADIAIFTKDHFAQTLAQISNSTHICSIAELAVWLQRHS